MKKKFLFLAFSILLFSFESFGQDKTAKDLYGKWVAVGSNSEQSIILEIHEDGKVIYNDNGEVMKGVYKVDFSKKPIWFDITAVLDGRKHILMGIFRFRANDTLEWEPLTDNKRKTSLSEEFVDTAIFFRSK